MRRFVVFGLALSMVAPAAASAWTWPVDGPVLQRFSFGSDPYAAGQHRGIDIGASTGGDVAAPVGGTVTFAGTVPVSGKSLTIETGSGYSVTLTHLASFAVRRGDGVAEGATVGILPSATSSWTCMRAPPRTRRLLK